MALKPFQSLTRGYSYFEGAIYQIKGLVGRYDDECKNELNAICSAHVVVLDVEEVTPKRFSYCGCDVLDGKLRILFQPDCLGTNIDAACEEGQIIPALNSAPSPTPLSFSARLSIRADFDAKVEECRKQIADATGNSDFKLNGNFADVFAKLNSVGKGDLREDWQSRLGGFTLNYFEGLAYQMKSIHVADDEMVREGFNEAVEKGEAAFRVVDSLTYGSYCECVIEDGVLYLQVSGKICVSDVTAC